MLWGLNVGRNSCASKLLIPLRKLDYSDLLLGEFVYAFPTEACWKLNLLEDIMEVSAISALRSASDISQGQGNKAGSANFSEHLEKQLAASMEQNATLNQPDKAIPASMVNVKIDQEDERAATAELLRFYKMLMSGKIDTGSLNNTDTNHSMADGPNRKTLETLKAVIRRLIGMQGAENDNMNNFRACKVFCVNGFSGFRSSVFFLQT